MPSVLSVVLLMSLPWSNKIGLLCAYYMNNFGGAPSFAMVVSWVVITTSGHTKVLLRFLLNICMHTHSSADLN